MKNLLRAFLLAIVTASSASADAVNYTILSISEARGNEQIFVDRAWRKDSPKRLAVKVRTAEEISANNIIAKAYFYDSDKKLIHTYAKPNLLWMNTKKGYEEVGLPPVLKKHDVVEIYFALTPELLKLNAKTTLIVFGDDQTVVVRSKNEVSPMDFNFPEKSKATEVKK